MSRSVVGIMSDGEQLAVPMQDTSVVRVAAVYGSEPEWIEAIPVEVEGSAPRVAAFVLTCMAKHWPERGAS